tara:strand:- start:685 stop:1617 length:933 start_codon:yes stop_codon:yes gene_type:complete
MLLIGVVGLLSGQQGCQRSGSGDTEIGTGPFVGGNDGLSIAFVEDAPPLGGNFQGEAIDIEVDLTNNGETDVATSAAVINLIGTVTGNSFTLTQTGAVMNTGLIERIRDSSDVADSDFVDLGTATLTDANIGPSWSPNIRAQVCYPYTTDVQIDDLCIPGQRNEAGSVECEIDNAENLVDKGDVSGAPVQVTSVVESRTGDGIRVRLDIENQGNGEVIATTHACNNAVNVPTANRDLVRVSVPGFSCTFKTEETDSAGTIELRNGKGRLRCTKPVSAAGRAYLDRFSATLTYNYVEETGKTISIQNSAAF